MEEGQCVRARGRLTAPPGAGPRRGNARLEPPPATQPGGSSRCRARPAAALGALCDASRVKVSSKVKEDSRKWRGSDFSGGGGRQHSRWLRSQVRFGKAQ